ncbi:MAG: EAL domain-containing protein [Betaproteobacteria bacterium]|nr:EAL domain-containing protein [Betaproteobacteria bacterium]
MTDTANDPARRRCWVLVRDPARAAELGLAIASATWQVERVFSSMLALQQDLRATAAPPALLLMSLTFDDGDGLQLIRSLALVTPCPAIFIVSRQQRAVIKSALMLAAVCGVPVAGSAEEPVSAAEVASRLQGFQPLVAWLTAAANEPALSRAELRLLLDRGGLQAWMQPQLRIKTREIVGFEALMRARDNDGGLIMPDRLLPGLAKHGLLEEATLRMLQQTVAFVAESLKLGLAVSGSINASLRSLSDWSFCQTLPEVVSRAGLDPSWITIEITETDAMSDLAHVVENTARIRMLGFNLAIDDFGMAYSSLSQLSSMPFSELKLDRVFVHEIDRDPRMQAIVRGCATLGRLLDLRVVAEGVESMQELDAVAQVGCTHVQGYLVSGAMAPGKPLPWLATLPDLVWTPGR